MARPSGLAVHPRDMVYALLKDAPKPLTAYQLFDKLKPEGVGGVTIIYRALETLEKQSLIHKVKELSAYIACNCIEAHKAHFAMLTVCCDCNDVKELNNKEVIASLQSQIRMQANSVIELSITCEDCSNETHGAAQARLQ